MLTLEFIEGPLAGKSIRLDADKVVIGRSSSSTVVLDDPLVSGVHCVLEKSDGGYQVVDVGSTTGTRVGSPETKRIGVPIALRPGDAIFVGDSKFVVRFGPETAGIGAGGGPRGEVAVEGDAGADPGAGDLADATIMDDLRSWMEAARDTDRHSASLPEDLSSGAPSRGAEEQVEDPYDPNKTILGVSPFAGSAPRTRKDVDAFEKRPPAAPIQTATERVAENATQPWEGVTEEHFIVERPDTSNEPVPIPETFRDRIQLVFLIGPHAERRVYLGKKDVSLGRAEDNDVVLHDALASRRHARITCSGSRRYKIEPLKGDNPPTINGSELKKPRALDHGDIVGIGSSVLEVVDPLAEAMHAAEGTTVMVAMPRFCFRGEVVQQPRLTIGRDPASDLFIDDDDVDRHHAEVQFDDGAFVLKDVSEIGTYVGGKRVVSQRIHDGDVVHIADWELKFGVDAVRCSIDLAAPRRDGEDAPVFAPELESAAPYQALYRVALSPEMDPVRKPGSDGTADEGKAKTKKRKRSWTPPRDIQKTRIVPMIVALAVALTLGSVTFFSTSGSGGATFLRRPLSPAHGGEHFMARAAADFSTQDRCVACHVAFTGPASDRCVACHDGREHATRPLHGSSEATGGKARPSTCTDCHAEHRPRSTALLATERCMKCHEDRHREILADAPSELTENVEPPIRASMGVNIRADFGGFTWAEQNIPLHKHHQAKATCLGCHAGTPGRPDTPSAWRACKNCHGADQFSSGACGNCHREHGSDWSQPVGLATLGPPTPIFATFGVVILLLIPLGFVLGFHHVTRSRREEREAEQKWKDEEALAKAAPAEGKYIHNINLEKCVGCASCVNACPNDVLELEPKRHKSTVVRFDNCHQCRACEQICPSGALTMSPAGAPPRMVELPDLDSNYETNIPGVYLIGEAAGKSLVKNANNLGYRVVQHMMAVRGIGPGSAKAHGHDVEVICVGSGPGGLAAGITCFRSGLSHIIFEKDRLFASTIQTYPKKKELLAEPPEVGNIGPLPVWDSHKEEILEKWFEELKQYALDIRCGEEVRAIKPSEKGGFTVTTSKGTYSALKIVLATGTRGNPRQLKIPGGDLDKVHYVLVDADEYDGKDVMVVGGGDTALEAAIALAQANQGSNRVSLSYRKPTFERAKDRNKEIMAQLASTGRITLYLETNPLEVRPDSVVLESADKSTFEVPNAALYCMLGADPPVKWLKEIGVQYVKKPENWSPGPSDDLSFLELQRIAS